MENKVMRIYYGSDCLPYKDEERTVHYPIVGKVGGGSVITGENNTTTIQFYVGLVGSNSKTYVATIKKPSGTILYRVLSAGVSTDDDYYVSLDIAEIYANEVGNLVIGLNGYDGSTNITTDDDDLVINGNTTCIALGTINILCNYAPQVLTNAYGLDPSDLQLLLTAINQKADKLYTIVVVNQLNNTLEFDNNQIVFSIADKKFYKYLDSETYPNNFVVATDYYSQSEIDTFLSGKQDTLISGTNIKTINNQSILGGGNINIQGGGGGATYTAGNGITIDAQNVISADITESITNGYIKVGSESIKVYDDTNIREVAEGKCKAVGVVLLSKASLLSLKNEMYFEKALLINKDGTATDITDDFINTTDYDDIKNDTFLNASSSDQYGKFTISSGYLVGYYALAGSGNVVLSFYSLAVDTTTSLADKPKGVLFNTGDEIYITDKDVPDRWVSVNPFTIDFYELETKVDLSNYYNKSEIDLINKNIEKITAPLYDSTATYSVGDLVIYQDKLYKCTTDIDAPEDFDNAHWSATSVKDAFAKLDTANTFTAKQTFNNYIGVNNIYNLYNQLSFALGNSANFTYHTILPDTTDAKALGNTTNSFKELYLSRHSQYKNPNATTYFRQEVDGSNNLITSKSTDGTTWDNCSWYSANGDLNIKHDIVPSSNNVSHLGSSSKTFSKAYIGVIEGLWDSSYYHRIDIGQNMYISYYASGTKVADNITFFGKQTNIYGLKRIEVDADNNANIATSTKRVKDLYLAGNISDGTNNVTVAQLKKATYSTVPSGNVGSITSTAITTGWYKHTIAISGGVLDDAIDVRVKVQYLDGNNQTVVVNYPAILNNKTELVIFSGLDLQTEGAVVSAVYYKEN